MKFIEKDIRNEPESLRIYRNTTENPTFDGLNKTDVRLSLLKEQGHICAYCMNRISIDLSAFYKPQVEIEHYKSQENFPKDDLNFMNMLGVCNGTIRRNEIIEHCDKSRKFDVNGNTSSYEFEKLNPTKRQNSELLITYDMNGKIKSVSNDAIVEEELNRFLNLNNKYLIEYRIDARDKARNQFENENPRMLGRRWTKDKFDRVIEKYKAKNSEGRYKPFCQYVIWYFELLKTKNKYSSTE